MEYLAAFVITFLGWYLTTHYAAFIDGVRDPYVFRCAWWPCNNANSVQTKYAVMRAAIRCHNETDDINMKMFALNCAIVARNNIMRCNPNEDIDQFKINGIKFETYVHTFRQSVEKVNR